MKKHIILFTLLLLFSSAAGISEIIEKVNVIEKVYSSPDRFAGITIISRAELEKLNINSLSSLFRYLPGITVARRGPGDVSYDLIMRGGNFEQISLMVEGIPVNNPQTGHFNSDLPFTFNDIDRIEISSGTSVDMTPSGFSGSVNIILRKDKKLKLKITTGEKNFFSGTISRGFEIGKLKIRVSGGKKNSRGYYEGREFDITNFLVNGRYKRKSYSAVFSLGKIKKDFGAKNFYAPFSSLEDINSDLVSLKLKKNLGKYEMGIEYLNSRHRDHFVLDRYNPDFYKNDSNTEINNFRIFSVIKNRITDISFGADLRIEDMQSSAMGSHNRKRGGGFFNIFYSLKNLKAAGSMRLDLTKNGKYEMLFDLNFKKIFGNSFSVSFSSSRNIRYPSFTEFFYNSPSNLGNTELENERSFNNSLEFSFFHRSFIFNMSVFYRIQGNMIDWLKSPGEKVWKASNISGVNFSGFELSFAADIKNGGIRSSLEKSYVNVKNTTFISKYGLRFPDLLIKAGGFFDLHRKVRLNLNYEFKRIFENREKGHFLDGVITISYRIFKLSLHADNIFNTMIEEIPGVKIPGRWIYLSFSI